MRLDQVRQPIMEFIKKVKVDGVTKYRVISHQTHKNFGTYDTEEEAEERLRQMKRFRKH